MAWSFIYGQVLNYESIFLIWCRVAQLFFVLLVLVSAVCVFPRICLLHVSCARSWNRSSASRPTTAKGSRTGQEGASQPWAILSLWGKAHTWSSLISALFWALQMGRGWQDQAKHLSSNNTPSLLPLCPHGMTASGFLAIYNPNHLFIEVISTSQLCL